jgi:D-alanyl-lipoteichoic acid acyltransferase DltB (MBOAT superfamily)
MTIGGLWHGPNWTFLIWGLLHGIGLAILRLFETMRGKTRSQLFAARLIRRFTTFQFVCLCWVFFRAADLKTAGQILTQIGSLHFAFDNVSLGLWLVLAIAALIHFTPKEWLHSVDRWFCAAPAFVQAAAMLAVIFAIQYVGATGAAPFVYTKF